MRFFEKLRNGCARFMYGRYGMDQMGISILWVTILLSIVEMVIYKKREVTIIPLQMISTFLLIFYMLRVFSKNKEKRRRENDWFCRTFLFPVQRSTRNIRQRMSDKEHKYFVCRKCHTMCRVPRGKGKVIITCPKCKNEFHGRS